MPRTSLICIELTLLAVLVLPGSRTSSAAGSAPQHDSDRHPGCVDLILTDIQRLDGSLRHLLDVMHAADVEGSLDASLFRSRVDLLDGEVGHLERRIAGCDHSSRLDIEAKLATLKHEIRELDVALRTGHVEQPMVNTLDDLPVMVGKATGRRRQAAAPMNDDCADAVIVNLGTFAGTTSDATNDGQAVCGSSLDTPDAWFRFVATESGPVSADTRGSSYDTVLSVHSGCPGTIANQLECNDDAYGLQSLVAFDAVAGREYLIRVSGAARATGAYQLTLAESGSALGGIRGNVSRAIDQEPVSAPIRVFDQNEHWVESATTDGAGNWEVGGLASGVYFVGTDLRSSSTLRDEMWEDTPCRGGPILGCDPSAGDPITVVEGAVTPGIDFRLDELGKVSGTVQDATSQEGIEQCEVRLWKDNGGYTTFTSRYTDQNGAFTFTSIDPGTYYVTADHDLYEYGIYDGMTCTADYSLGCDPTSGTPVTVTVNAPVEGVDFSLLRQSEISGVVLDAQTGSPVSSAEVEVWKQASYPYKRVHTEADGTFVIGGLPEGTYRLNAEKADYLRQFYDHLDCNPGGCSVASGTPIPVPANSTLEGLDFDLTPLGRIAGTVTDMATREPLVSSVKIYNQEGSLVDTAQTDSAGEYRSMGMPDGTYFVAVLAVNYVSELYDDIEWTSDLDLTTGAPVSVVLGQVTDGIDFALARRGGISGHVTHAVTGDPLSDYRVTLYKGGAYQYPSVKTQATGEYEFTGLLPGTYVVALQDTRVLAQIYDGITCPGGSPSACDVTSGTPVEVAVSTTTTGVDFEVQLRGNIEGTIRTSDGGDAEGYFGVYEDDGEYAGGGSFSASDGSTAGFAVDDLLPGDYRVVADAHVSSYGDVIYDGVACPGEFPESCDLGAGTLVTVAAEQSVTGIDIVLDPLGSIAGTVTIADTGEPVTGGRVTVLDSEGDDIWYSFIYPDGTYRVERLYDGLYYVLARPNTSGLIRELYDGPWCTSAVGDDGCELSSATPVVLSGRPNLTGIDFALDRTGEITGRVTDAVTGIPVPVYDERIRLWNAQGSDVGYSFTDSEGRYSFPHLIPGTYFVTTATDSYGTPYIDELFDDHPCFGSFPASCDPTKGTPILVHSGSTVRFVDFALEPRISGITGRIVRSGTGAPIHGIAVDAWIGSGELKATDISDPQGRYLLDVPAGTYFVSTENPDGLSDEIFDDIVCKGGSAHGGQCDPTSGDPVVVLEDRLTKGVSFALDGPPMPFRDSFESGGVTAWSLVIR